MAIAVLPDLERRTEYTLVSASTGPLDVDFSILADGTDYANWIEVWDDGVKLTGVTHWTLDSPSGSLATIARPITDARITFTSARTGVIQIVGRRRPRRTTQFTTGAAIPVDDHNRAYTDLMASLREQWDLTGRTLLVPPGETLSTLPKAATRASKFVAFDADGDLTVAEGSVDSVPAEATSIAYDDDDYGPTVDDALDTIIALRNKVAIYANGPPYNVTAGEDDSATGINTALAAAKSAAAISASGAATVVVGHGSYTIPSNVDVPDNNIELVGQGNGTRMVLADGASLRIRPTVARTITAITQTNPAVVTAVGHGYTTRDAVIITDVSGMTQINGAFSGITVLTADTFSLNSVDASGYSAYTSGGAARKEIQHAAIRRMKVATDDDYEERGNIIFAHTRRCAVSDIFFEGCGGDLIWCGEREGDYSGAENLSAAAVQIRNIVSTSALFVNPDAPDPNDRISLQRHGIWFRSLADTGDHLLNNINCNGNGGGGAGGGGAGAFIKFGGDDLSGNGTGGIDGLVLGNFAASDFQTGIAADLSDGKSLSNVVIGNGYLDCGTNGHPTFELVGSNGSLGEVAVSNVRINHYTTTATDDGTNNGRCLYVNFGGAGGGIVGLSFNQCIFWSPHLEAVYGVQGSSALVEGVTFNACQFTGTGPRSGNDAASAVRLEGNFQALVITNNTVRASTFTWANGFDLSGLTNTYPPVFANNQCKGIGATGKDVIYATAHDGLMRSAADGLINGAIVWSVSSNALTAAIKTKAGNDPAPNDPVLAVFRSATVTSGSFEVLRICAAHSLTAPDTATLGTVSNFGFVIRCVGVKDGSTFRLGFYNACAVNEIVPFDEGYRISSSAIGVGSTSALTFYTGTGVTAKAFREMSIATWHTGLATAGTWSAGPDQVEPVGPGTLHACHLVQRRRAGTTTKTDNATTSYVATALSETFTARSGANLITIRAGGNVIIADAANTATLALQSDATILAEKVLQTSGTGTFDWSIDYLARVGSSAVVFAIYIKSGNGGQTVSFPSSGSTATMVVEEWKG